MAAILKVKDDSGNWIDIPALKGDSGDGGGTQYKHCMTLQMGVRGHFYFEVVDGTSTKYTTLYAFQTAHPNGKYALTGFYSYIKDSKRYLCVEEYITTGESKIKITFSGIPSDSLTANPEQFTIEVSAGISDTVYELT